MGSTRVEYFRKWHDFASRSIFRFSFIEARRYTRDYFSIVYVITRTEEGNGVSLSGCSSAQSFLIFVKREKQWKLGEARCNAMRYASPLSRRTVDTSRTSRTCASMERSNRLADLLARSNCFRQKTVPMYRYVQAPRTAAAYFSRV